MDYLFEYRRYRLPFRVPLRTAHGPWGEREGLLVRLTAADGRVGYGEAAPMPWFGTEGIDDDEAACRELGSRVAAAQLAAIPANLGCLRHALAAAQGSGLPPPVQPHVAVAALLPAGRAGLAPIAARAEVGFRTFKWKVGVGELADELSLLDDVCAALPEGARLRLDANGAWDRRQAERWLERCAERPVEFVEQPCLAAPGEGESRRARVDDLLLGLAHDFPTPIALDESLAGERDLERWIARAWRGVFVVKPALLGDVAGALARLAAAKADVVFSSALETVVGAKAALRLAFEWPGKPRALGFGVWPLFVESVFDGPFGAPFIRSEDVKRLNPEAAWTALN